MSIQAANGIAVRCNICNKNGPIIPYDSLRYQHVAGDPNHPNEVYMRSIQSDADKSALTSGFVRLPEAEVHLLYNIEGAIVAHEGGPILPQNMKHLCPSCIEHIANRFEGIKLPEANRFRAREKPKNEQVQKKRS